MSACLTDILCAKALTLIFVHNMRSHCKRNSVLEWKKVGQSTSRTKDKANRNKFRREMSLPWKHLMRYYIGQSIGVNDNSKPNSDIPSVFYI